MHDQIRSADAIGIRAASLTSADSDRERTVERLPRRRARPALCRAGAGDDRAAFASFCASVAAGADRHRRSALRQRMGARFPARLSPARDPARRSSGRAAAGADRDRRRAHPRRHPGPARHPRRRADRRRVRPAQHPLSRPPRASRPASSCASCWHAQPAPAIVYAPSRDKAEKIAEQIAATVGPRCPITPGSSRRCARATRRRSSIPRRW